MLKLSDMPSHTIHSSKLGRLIAVASLILIVGSGCSSLKKTWNAIIGKDDTGTAQELA